MGLKVRTNFQSRLSTQWLKQTEDETNLAALAMATDVQRHAAILAPKDKGNLVNSARIEPLPNKGGYVVSFGGNSGGVTVPYATAQEFGATIVPKNGEYLHFQTSDGNWVKTKKVVIPATHFLSRAGENVERDKQKYFRGK